LASKNENIFSSFKRYPEYTDILEHCNYEQGKLYSKWCLNSNNFTLEKLLIAKNNDIVGNAKIEEYPAPIGKISPSSLRYLKVLLELELLFGDLSGKDIVEIGVGYGGQCKLIKETFKVKSYSLVDLEEPLLLAKRYLQDDSLNYMTMEELPSDKKYDLIISNYAFTECNKDVQLEYIQKIIKNSAHGYITFNNISHLFDVKSFSKEELSQFFSFTEMEENPCIFAGNAILIW
jgi:hypothetical protein